MRNKFSFENTTSFDEKNTKAFLTALELKTDQPIEFYYENQPPTSPPSTLILQQNLIQPAFLTLLAQLKNSKPGRPIYLTLNCDLSLEDIIPKYLAEIFKNGNWPPNSTLVFETDNLDPFTDILPELKSCPENFTLRLQMCQPSRLFMLSLATYLPHVPRGFSLEITRSDGPGDWNSENFPYLITAIRNVQAPLFSLKFTENGNETRSNSPISEKEITLISRRRFELMHAVADNKKVCQLTAHLDDSEIPLLAQLITKSRPNLQLNIKIDSMIDHREKIDSRLGENSGLYNLLARPYSSLHSLEINSDLIDPKIFIHSLTTNKKLKNLFIYNNNSSHILSDLKEHFQILKYINSDLRIKLYSEIIDNKEDKTPLKEKIWRPFQYRSERRQFARHLSESLPFPQTVINICMEFEFGTESLRTFSDLSTYFYQPLSGPLPSVRDDPSTGVILAWRNPELLTDALLTEITDCLIRTLKIQPTRSMPLLPAILHKLLNIGFWYATQKKDDYIVQVHPEKFTEAEKILEKSAIATTGITFKVMQYCQLYFSNINVINLALFYCLKYSELKQALAALHILPPSFKGSIVNVPSDGNCLFWSIALAWLYEDKSQFSQRYDKLFGSEICSSRSKFHFQQLLNQPTDTLTADPIAKELICRVFRQKIIDYAATHLTPEQRQTIAADTGHSDWKSYETMARMPNSFAGQAELLLISSFIGRNITVLAGGFLHKLGSNGPTQKTLKLFYVNAQDKPDGTLNHYRFLLETESKSTGVYKRKTPSSTAPLSQYPAQTLLGAQPLTKKSHVADTDFIHRP